MQLRDRVKELRRVKASELLSHPKNWRRHPQAQRDALRTMLDRVGYVDAVIARETPGGLMLIDGHLRTGLTPDAEIPVLVVDLDESEADEVLATLDPLVAMAETEAEALQALVDSLAARADEGMTALLADMHSLLEPLDIEGYEPMDIDKEEVSDEDGDDFVMIQFSVLRQFRRDIIRRIEPILAEYTDG